ncbi:MULTISPECIES: carbon-nitrogen hydrolase [Peribacillus]|uniref:N-carbamoylputrescine amidase n=1 Tax=Peribacillus simplex TaxID=1478 RepID=A0A125QRI8_9BACI|nr:carbon-nitrogen hydrolase [Peribacillus simplex]KWW16498.1 N-carbamoylputrescine amidase [Peribacillus simplex]
MSKVKVGLIQIHCGENIEQNIQKTMGKIKETANKGAQIVCLQELFSSEYFPQTVNVKNYDLAEETNSGNLVEMGELAKELAVVLIVPFYERAGSGVYFNSAAVFDADGECLGITRKNHIPDGPQYHEKYYFVPGNTGYPVYETAYGKIGVGICWDEWFPEVARIMSLQGAEILFYPSAIGSEPDHPGISTRSSWEKAISAHGISNGVFVAATNRVGQEKDMNFYGGSFISDPLGNILASLDEEEGIIVQEIDLKEIERTRNMLQFFRDRRVDTYAPILQKELLPTPSPSKLVTTKVLFR